MYILLLESLPSSKYHNPTHKKQACKRPKMSQRPYLRAFCKVRKSHFKISFTKNFINPSRLSLEAGSRNPFYQISRP